MIRTGAAGIFLEALRLDRASEASIRSRASEALESGAGGFLLFGGEARQVRELVAELRSRAGRPLWIAADLERGPGQQFAGEETLPPPAALARHPDPDRAVRIAGSVTGRRARDLGVDLVLAPVLDLDVEPENPIVGPRSFGGDPEVVARLGALWIEACQEAGVAACAKHFPGHGRTRTDSHAGLPVVEAGREALESDLRPFREVAGRVATMMSAHVAYPSLDAPGPASLEPRVLTGLLRGEMGFSGLVVSDAMNMAGFSDQLRDGGRQVEDEGALAVRALLAGCDLLLYPRDLSRAAGAVERAAARSSEVGERLSEALDRSRAVRGAFVEERDGAPRRPGSGPGAGRRAGPVEGSVEGPGDVADLDRLAEECLVPRGEAPGERLRPPGAPGEAHPRHLRLLACSDDPEGEGADAAAGREGGVFGRSFADELWAGGVGVASAGDRAGGADEEGGARGETAGGWLRELGFDPTGPPGAGRGSAGPGAPTVILLRSTPRAWKGRAGPGEALRSRIRRAAEESGGYLVVFGHLRLLEELAVAGVCAWWPEPRMERAAARWLLRRLELLPPTADGG